MTRPGPEGAGGRLPRMTLLAYALPAFVVALPTIPVYIHLPSLYGVGLGVGLTTVGLVLLVARIFDTVTDPLIGALSDRYPFLGCRRKPWIAVGAVIAGLGLYKVLGPPADADAAYLMTWSIVLYAGWTMVAVPYMAWGAELSAGYNERTRITSWREAIALIGIVGAGAVTAGLTQSGWGEAEAAHAIAWLAIGLGVVVLPLMLRMVPDRAAARAARRPIAWREIQVGLRDLAANRPFLRLIGAWFLNGLANGIPAALFLIYLEHGLGAGEQERPLFILVYFIAAVAAVPLWLGLSRRFGKHRVWCWAMLTASAAFVAVPVLDAGAFVAFGVICVITGMALGADLALPPAIQADVVDYDRWRFRHDRAGLQFALWGMATKLALAVAVGLALPGLDFLGFDPDAPTDQGTLALVVIYALVPVVIKVMAIMVVWRFPLTRERHAIIRRRLDRFARARATIEEPTK